MIHGLDFLRVNDLDSSSAIPSSNPATKLYLKQVAYVGTFAGYSPDGKKLTEDVVIDPATLNHWCSSVKEQVKDGVAIPVQLTHEITTDPNDAKGYVIDATVSRDSKDREALFFVVEVPVDNASLLAVSDVSVYQPPSYCNGTGKKYIRPIRHLMLTTAPVIPGMDKFVALSLLPSKATSMEALRTLAAIFGIQVASDATEASLTEAIATAYKAVSDSVAALTTKVAEQAAALAAATQAPPVVAMSIPPALVSLNSKLRGQRIDSLVAGGKLTPAQADKLRETWLSPTGAAIALSLNAESTDISDPAFDSVIAAFEAAPSSGVIGRATILPKKDDGSPATTNRILARARAKAAAATK